MLELQDINLTDADYQRLSDVVYRYCGINLHEGKKELARSRLVKHIRRCGFANAREYLDHVLRDPGGPEFTKLIDSISTNLTSFFREHDHFDHLSGVFLPALLARKHKAGCSRIRAWSAACSTGEEPYSLAMTLLDALGSSGAASWDARILATDISTRVLRIAEAGMYEKDRVGSVSAGHRAKYLAANRIDGKVVFSVMPAARALVRFAHLNLMETWPFSGAFDFIFCRNVMIYFDKSTQQKLVNRFWGQLEPGGLLFTGHSESLTGISHRFRYVQPTIYQKDA
jgi:chemotaxis protein methyltransferase CheR